MGFSARNAGFGAFSLERIAEPISVIAPHPLSLGQFVKQGCSTSVIADLACGDEETERATIGVRDGVLLGVHAAFGGSNQSPAIPFLPAGWRPCGAL
jgi:hypothetical protein